MKLDVSAAVYEAIHHDVRIACDRDWGSPDSELRNRRRSNRQRVRVHVEGDYSYNNTLVPRSGAIILIARVRSWHPPLVYIYISYS